MTDKSTKSAPDQEEREALWIEQMLVPIMFCVVVLIVVMTIFIAFKFMTYMRPSGWEEDFSQTIAEDQNIDDADPDRLNLAVLPDYRVNEKNPYIYIPYPVDNAHDISFTFRDKDDGTVLYSTKRIRPGTVVRVNPYEFCQKGNNALCVDVTAYLGMTSRYYVKNITLETNINKGEVVK